MKRIAVCTWVLLAALPSAGADVPTYEAVLGRPFGERITLHHEMVNYLRSVAAASPRVEVRGLGESWEEKELLLAIVTSPENHARLDEIKRAAQRLRDPRRTSAAEMKAIVERQPVVLWFGGSIHGFELSGTEGVLKLFERLTTADDPSTLEILAHAVVLIDPMLNPDGRDSFAHVNHENLGREMRPERDDWGNDYNRWEGLKFRTGHYYFDTNRDWFAQTQKETRSRVPVFLEWAPQIIVDLHEMGPDVEFYFDPPTDPYPPYFPDFARRWFHEFGRAYAAAFDGAGFEYMTRERYNYFYPGYTTSYGSYQGAVGMLYEQGSSRGLVIERADESVRKLTHALEQQYTAAWTAVRIAVAKRDELLKDYYESHRAAVEDGRRGFVRYLVEPVGDPRLLAEFVRLLLRNGIEVSRLTEGIRLTEVKDRFGTMHSERVFPPGSYVVEAAQPRNRLIRTLLEVDQPLAPLFLIQARKRIDRGESPRFYDITAWSLPLLFNVHAHSVADPRPLTTEVVGEESLATAVISPRNAEYAYLIDGTQAASLAALYRLKEHNYRAAVLRKPTRIADEEFGSGTVIVRVGQNEESVHGAVREIAAHFGVSVTAVDTGLSGTGFPALGSGDAIPIKKPRIAILAEDSIHAYSFGWAWYTLDRQYEIPVTIRRVRSVAEQSLSAFDTLILPDLFSVDALAQELREAGVERIKGWVRDGGTLVALGAAVDFVREKLELTSLRSWYAEETQAAERDPDSRRNRRESPTPQKFSVPGAILRATFDLESWLSAGYSETFPVLVNSSRIYLAPEGPPRSTQRVVVRYAYESLLISGHLWPESRRRLANTVFAYEERIGKGRVVAFAEDLNFRAYWRGADRLFLNAVIVGPSAP